ncbi:MAG: hypothetical protein QW518_04145 [Thermofilaceae archaeon]
MPELDPRKVLAEEVVEEVQEGSAQPSFPPSSSPVSEGKAGLDWESILAFLDSLVLPPEVPRNTELRRVCARLIGMSKLEEYLPSFDENTPFRTRLAVAGIGMGLYLAANIWTARRFRQQQQQLMQILAAQQAAMARQAPAPPAESAPPSSPERPEEGSSEGSAKMPPGG